MSLDACILYSETRVKILENLKQKKGETILVGYAATRACRAYTLIMNIVMESVNVVFDDKNIQGLMDEGNHDTLQFENEHIGDFIESDEEECSHGKSISVDVISSMENLNSSMDNPHPSMITYQLMDIYQLIIHQLINLLQET